MSKGVKEERSEGVKEEMGDKVISDFGFRHAFGSQGLRSANWGFTAFTPLA